MAKPGETRIKISIIPNQKNKPNLMKKRIKISWIILTILLFVNSGLLSQTSFVPGKSYFGRKNYIEYIAGNLPIIISAPHGGSLTPSEIPDRTCGDETVTDSYTANLAMEIKDAIFQITGCYPHVIICQLKRTKLDANRDLPEAACGNEFAEIAWNEFHDYIDSAKIDVIAKSGKGLYIDLHGHGHAIQRLELGYMLTATQLRYSDVTLNTTTYKNLSSILNLINSNILNLSHAELLRGMKSLGTLFAAKGFPSVPSIDDPYPLVGQTYFSGGYNTLVHGSKTEGTIDGIQIECNQDVRFIESSRKIFAAKTGEVLLDYLINHYFPQLPLTYCNIVDVQQIYTYAFKVYPNPFDNVITINNIIPADLKIYNYQGRLVWSGRLEGTEEIDLGHLPDGMYFASFSDKGILLFTKKIVKGKLSP